MKTPVRRAKVTLLYNSADISASVEPYLLSFEYNDIFDSRSTDDLKIDLENKDGLWRSGWFPERGATITAKLTCHDWPGGKVLDCGKFEIDEISDSGPPNVVSIGALAVGITTSIRRQKISKAWNDTNLQMIAEEVAGNHGFELVYDSSVIPEMKRYDQREQTDAEMLGELCDNSGLGLKLTDKKILIYEGKMYDARPPERTFTRGVDGYKHHNFRVSSADIYKACEVQYLDPQQRILINCLYSAETSDWSEEAPPTGQILKINQYRESEEDAKRLARAKLREANKREMTGEILYLGNPDIRSGIVVSLANYGIYDEGKYITENVRHKSDKSGGYETTVQFRGTLKY